MNFSPRTLLIYVISQASRGAHVRIVLGRPNLILHHIKVGLLIVFDIGRII